ncbi:putative enzyme related to lactoylglutathione lyase [Bacillus tianshenii]|uniref:Enzyme related to lactoylglutathione lyase n=2 Tax=Sutcliffiella tianshenii TaxID=1463404 RepID=A0ABS2P2R6_9BACI|nr:putative enzyme related to lactoylglutathione lyase [Bacillus tianshenii]
MLNKVCVITIKVGNIQEAVQFYTEILDFKVSKYYGENIVSLVHEGLPIVLEKADSIKTETYNSVLLGILSQDIEKDFASLKEKGATILFDEPQPCPPGRFFVLEDPFGNRIEVVEFSNME